MTTVDLLTQGREACDRLAWRDAYEHLSAADQQESLEAEDLDRLARAAYLTGHIDAANDAWERTHHAFLDRGETAPAVRCAFWLGLTLVQRGEHARGGGWLGRAQHLLEDAALDCVEQGYLRIPMALQTLESGDPETAYHSFVEVTEMADRFGDADLRALGRLAQGRSLVAQGQAAHGLALLDEAMVAVTTGDVSPLAAGIVYCAMIIVCRAIFDLRRVQEWTAVLSRWCATQQDLKPYRGQCLVHRSEIMQLRGSGSTRWTRFVRPASTCPTRPATRCWAWRCTSRASCSGCAASWRKPRDATARPAAAGTPCSLGWRRSGLPRAGLTTRPPPSAGRSRRLREW
jgi:hypothetical protein